jgi:hypothetical protein
MTKRYSSFAILGLIASLLTACGGGGGASNGSVVPVTPDAPLAADSAPTAAPTLTMSTTSGSIPKHVQTAEYLTTSTEIATSPSTYAPYLTWAYLGKASQAAAVRAAGIKVVLYSNPLMPHGSSYEKSEISSTYANVRARDCNGNLITSYSGTGYLADVRNSSADSYLKNVEDHYVNLYKTANPSDSHPYDAIFIDNANSTYGTSALPCNFSASTWTTDMDSDIQADGYPTIVNGLETNETGVASKVAGLKASNIIGGEYEECYNNKHWLAEEMSALQTIALLKSEGKAPGPGFWCYLDLTSASASTVIPWRLYAYASFLLTYDPNYSVWQTSFSTPSTFKVMPETGFVPLNPLSQPTQISDLKIASGAYVRRYGACYYRGSLVGSCEIAVNPGTSTVSLPNSYAHSAVISGSGVLDGGTVSFNGPAVTSLAPGTAAILIGSSTSTPAPTATATPATTGQTTVSGKIKYISSSKTKYELLQSNGTYVWAYFQLGVVSNAYVGEYMTATGTGTNPVYATSYSLSTSPTTSTATASTSTGLTTISGKIKYISASKTKYELLQSNGTYLWAYFQLGVVSNAYVGEYMKATGTGTNPVYATSYQLSTTAF